MSELDRILAVIDEKYNRLDDKFDKVNYKIDNNTAVTQDGFEKINGRLRKVEIEQAKRQAIDGLTGNNMSWQKLSFALVGIITTISLIVLAIVQGIFK
jgi:hypothetical protein